MQTLRNSFITAGQPFREGAVSVFEQRFSYSGGKAVLTLTALGIAEAQLNGKKVGDSLFTPGFTYYPRELQYEVFDIAGLLKPGENTLRVFLGQGWYCGRFTFDNKVQIYGDEPAAAWVLELDGQTITARDGVTMLQSPYEYAGLYDGEIYRAGSLTPLPQKPVPYAGMLPETFTQRLNCVRVREEMPVRAVYEHDGYTILDFGQNFAGMISIDPGKLQGECLKLRHGEILNADGSLYTTNLRKAKAELVYYKGTETEEYTPRFTYMGFRYVELSGAPYVEGLVTAHAIYSDMERTGDFSCENKNVQKLYENQIWGQKSNYVEVPTDCPQRDERMGYTGDGHVFAWTGAYNFDTRSFWRKFLADIRYSQLDNSDGYIPSTAPTPSREPQKIGFLSMLGWGNAVTLIPEMLEAQYGDSSFLTEQYDSIARFVDCECRKAKLFGLWRGPSLGDWLAPGKDMKYMALHNGPVSNAFLIHDLKVASALAEKLGKREDAARWRTQLEKSRKAYRKTYVKKDGSMGDDYQGAYVMALKFVLPQGELYQKVYDKLKSRLVRDGMQTGFFATQHLLPLLCDNGDSALAYDLLLQPNCPGWMYQVERGATTTWERWDALRPDGTVNEEKSGGDNMVSFNHYSFGSVGQFYYQYILGIRPAEPGYKKVALRPFVDKRLGGVSGGYRSVSGEIRSAWKFTGDTVTISVTTPVKAILTLPDGTEKTLSPGSYTFTC